MISVKKIDENTFDVTVEDGATTTHRVSLSDDYFKKLSQSASKEALIEKSFEFLLERESNTMILSQFDLPVIQSYFSNYESEIKKRV